jgi:hypothetical protein
VNPEVRAALEARMSGISPPANLGLEEDSSAEVSSTKKRSRRKPEHPTHVMVYHPETDSGGSGGVHKKNKGMPDLEDPVPKSAPVANPPTHQDTADASGSSVLSSLPNASINAGRSGGRSMPAVPTAGPLPSTVGTTIGFGPEAPPAPVPAEIMRGERSSKPPQPPTVIMSSSPDVAASLSVVSTAGSNPNPAAVISPTATGSTTGAPGIPASALSSVAAGAQSGRTIPWYFRGGSGPLTQQQEGSCILFPDASSGDTVRSDQVPVSDLTAERELQRLTALNASLQASSQSLKAALREAADAVRAAKAEANESRMSVQHEKEERAAERARFAAEERESKTRRDATLLNLAGVMQRMAQLEGVVRLEKLNLQMVGGAIAIVFPFVMRSLDMHLII